MTGKLGFFIFKCKTFKFKKILFQGGGREIRLSTPLHPRNKNPEVKRGSFSWFVYFVDGELFKSERVWFGTHHLRHAPKMYRQSHTK